MLVADCAADWSTFYDLKRLDDSSQLDITFSADDVQYRRTEALRNHQKEGWVEDGTWQASDDSGVAEVRVYLASLFGDYAFQKKYVKEMRTLVRYFSDQSYLAFGKQGQVNSNSGPIDYIFYRTGGRPCVLIRKFWSDPRASSDFSRAIGLNWAAGENVVKAYYCRASGADLQMQDMGVLFAGIASKDIYWPENMFVSVDGTFYAKSTSNNEGTDSDVDITGTYVSDITTPHRHTFKKRDYDIVITIIQVGNRITAADKSNTLKITGTLKGNVVKFDMLPNRINGYSDKVGEWIVNEDGTKMEGYWAYYSSPKIRTGQWNLTKVE